MSPEYQNHQTCQTKVQEIFEKAPNDVLSLLVSQIAQLTPGGLGAFNSILEETTDHPACFMKQENMAKPFGGCRKTANRAVKQLHNLGLINSLFRGVKQTCLITTNNWFRNLHTILPALKRFPFFMLLAGDPQAYQAAAIEKQLRYSNVPQVLDYNVSLGSGNFLPSSFPPIFFKNSGSWPGEGGSPSQTSDLGAGRSPSQISERFTNTERDVLAEHGIARQLCNPGMIREFKAARAVRAGDNETFYPIVRDENFYTKPQKRERGSHLAGEKSTEIIPGSAWGTPCANPLAKEQKVVKQLDFTDLNAEPSKDEQRQNDYEEGKEILARMTPYLASLSPERLIYYAKIKERVIGLEKLVNPNIKPVEKTNFKEIKEPEKFQSVLNKPDLPDAGALLSYMPKNNPLYEPLKKQFEKLCILHAKPSLTDQEQRKYDTLRFNVIKNMKYLSYLY